MIRMFAMASALGVLHALASAGFLFGNAWGGLLESGMASAPYLEVLPTLSNNATNLFEIFLVSVAFLVVEIYLWRRACYASPLLFCFVFSGAIVLTYALQHSLKQEYLSGMIFRTPPTPLGYLSVAAVYLSSVVIVHAITLLIIGTTRLLKGIPRPSQSSRRK